MKVFLLKFEISKLSVHNSPEKLYNSVFRGSKQKISQICAHNKYLY